MSHSGKARGWCFTLNNYTDKDIAGIMESWTHIKYLLIGFETGEAGTPHIQGYVEWMNAKTLNGLKRLHNSIHWEIRRGTPLQAANYCKKDGKFLEKGKPLNQGSRTDLHEIAHSISKGENIRGLVPKIENYQQFCFAEKITKYYEPRRTWKTYVTWIYGPTGTGKTKWASEEAPEAYWLGPNPKWWDGYDGHDDVIIDDYREGDFVWLLRLLDRYPLTIEVKGGTRQFLAKRLFITSPEEPCSMFINATDESLEQLKRRIDTCFHIDELSHTISGTEVAR